MGEIVALSKHEELQEAAPPRPATRDRSVVEAAFVAFAPAFRQATGASDPEHDRELIEHLFVALQANEDTWQVSRALSLKGWPMDTPLYDQLVGFVRYLETCRIEAEIAWVMKYGVRFPAKVGQRVAFTYNRRRHSGMVEIVDGKRARGIVRRPKNSGGDVLSVTSEQVTMVYQDGASDD